MIKYNVEIKSSLKKLINKLEQKTASQISDKINLLSIDPRHHGCIKLSGEENAYRACVGKYRIIYEIYDQKVLVMVINVDHQKDVYR